MTDAGGRERSLAGEIVEIAHGCASRRAFRDEALRLIGRHVGFDGAIFDTLDPSLPIDEGASPGIDRRIIERARAGWSSCYAAELVPLVRVAQQAGGVVVDSRVFGQRDRDRRRYFSEVLAPVHLDHMLWVHLQVRNSPISAIGLARSGRGFGDHDLQTMRALLPVFSLADGSFLLTTPSPDHEVEIPGLSPREREIARLVGLGYTNKEIAMALGTSGNTVRNQLSCIFRKAGVTTRAELAGITRSGR
jgi:DNA-binding CsgD family transcriptional regulator